MLRAWYARHEISAVMFGLFHVTTSWTRLPCRTCSRHLFLFFLAHCHYQACYPSPCRCPHTSIPVT
jgi:hypothetical protein